MGISVDGVTAEPSPMPLGELTVGSMSEYGGQSEMIEQQEASPLMKIMKIDSSYSNDN